MSGVKRGTMKAKRRRGILSMVKGFRFGRRNKKKLAREAILHSARHSFAHRRTKKGDRRRLWQIKISAATKTSGISYSTFIDSLKKKNIGLDRKVLADMAENNPKTFERIVSNIK